jgi:hypothetical protein
MACYYLHMENMSTILENLSREPLASMSPTAKLVWLDCMANGRGSVRNVSSRLALAHRTTHEAIRALGAAGLVTDDVPAGRVHVQAPETGRMRARLVEAVRLK